MGYYPAKEIQPGLWIGSEGDSQNPSFFTSNGIGFVVNCTKNIPFLKQSGVDCYRIPIDDTPRDNNVILSHFPVVVQAIDSVLQRGKGVLVHCRAGMQRSAATVAAYIMFKFKLNPKNAITAIQTRKTETFWPVPTFSKALDEYNKQLAVFNSTNNNSSALAPATPRKSTQETYFTSFAPNASSRNVTNIPNTTNMPSTPRKINSRVFS